MLSQHYIIDATKPGNHNTDVIPQRRHVGTTEPESRKTETPVDTPLQPHSGPQPPSLRHDSAENAASPPPAAHPCDRHTPLRRHERSHVHPARWHRHGSGRRPHALSRRRGHRSPADRRRRSARPDRRHRDANRAGRVRCRDVGTRNHRRSAVLYSYRTATTEHVAWWATRRVTDPMRNRSTAPAPLWPSMIRSAPNSSAAARIVSLTSSPSLRAVVTSTSSPRRRAEARASAARASSFRCLQTQSSSWLMSCRNRRTMGRTVRT
jgi:hypothetical protein